MWLPGILVGHSKMEGTYADSIKGYLDRVKSAIDGTSVPAVDRVIDELFKAYTRGSQVFVFGNGGSASSSSHFACDLGKGTTMPGKPRFRVISLADNVALMTAWANDFRYEDIFVEQLANLVQPQDVVIGISGSGNSPNVVHALQYAKEMGAITIALTGFAGGKVKDVVDIPIIVPANHISQIEDVHLVLLHLISVCLHDKLADLAAQSS